MTRRVLACVVVLLGLGAAGALVLIGRDGAPPATASSEFPAAGPGPTAPASPPTAPPNGALASDQSGCMGLAQPAAAAALTWIDVERAGGQGVATLRTEGGGCLLRLATEAVSGLAWADDGTAVFLGRAGVWHRVDVGGEQRPVGADAVPPGAGAFAVSEPDDRVLIPGGAALEVHRAADRLGIIIRHPDGGSALLADGHASHPVAGVGSPDDPSAIAWSSVPDGSAPVCGAAGSGRVTKATNVDGTLELEDTPAEGGWPVLWTPDGRLVLRSRPAGCDGRPDRLWVVDGGEVRALSSAALAVALRPGTAR